LIHVSTDDKTNQCYWSWLFVAKNVATWISLLTSTT